MADQAVRCPADIIFVLDESGSIGSADFNLMKSFVSQLVGRLDIDSGNTRVGLVTFSSSVGTYFNLNAYSTVASVQAAVDSLRYRGGGTNTFTALAHVRTTMLTSAAGDRSDVPNVVVVLSDGRSFNTTRTVVSIQHVYSKTSFILIGNLNTIRKIVTILYIRNKYINFE